MKSMMTISKSLLLFTKVVMVMSTWRNTKCDEYSPTYINGIVSPQHLKAHLLRYSSMVERFPYKRLTHVQFMVPQGSYSQYLHAVRAGLC